MGDLCAETGEFFGIFEEFNDLLKLFLLLLCACDVGKEDLLLGVGGGLDPSLGKASGLAALAADLTHHKDPEDREENEHSDVGQDGYPPGPYRRGLIFIGGDDPCRVLLCDKIAEILAEEGDAGKLIGNGRFVLERQLDKPLVVNEELGDLLFFEVRYYIAVLRRLLARAHKEGGEHNDEDDNDQDIDQNCAKIA